MAEHVQIFLSYARKDEEKIRELYHKLSEAGFKPWMDREDILPGELWERSIYDAIRQSRFFLVCLSANTENKRGFIQREIREALRVWEEMLPHDIYLIPVRLGPCEVQENLRCFQWVDLFRVDGWERLLQAIRAGLERWPVEEIRGVSCEETGLLEWWELRGYSSDPFVWPDAEDVSAENLFSLLQAWHIDPSRPAYLRGLGPTPTLDTIKSAGVSKPVLIYATVGSGKTFYRRWAVSQVEECEGPRRVLEIPDLAARLPDLQSVTACDLALCVYRSVCEKFSVPVSSLSTDCPEIILSHCDEVLQKSLSDSLYVFLDGVDRLLGEQPSAERSDQAFAALADFCRTAVRQDGKLALRIFMPAQAKVLMQERLGGLAGIRECPILWSAEHCGAVIERRLDSCWEKGANIGIVHVNRLLTPDVFDEVMRYLQRQGLISPRLFIIFFNDLAMYAYQSGVEKDSIGMELWNSFLGSGESAVLRA
jgi:hypothetical protein